MTKEPAPLFDEEPAAPDEPTPIPTSYDELSTEGEAELDRDAMILVAQHLEDVVDQLKTFNIKMERIALAVEQVAGASPAAQVITAQPPTAQSAGQGQVAQGTPWVVPSQQADPMNQLDVTRIAGYGWKCPIHGSFKVVPPGTSARTNKPYGAFIACTERDCNEKPPRAQA